MAHREFLDGEATDWDVNPINRRPVIEIKNVENPIDRPSADAPKGKSDMPAAVIPIKKGNGSP